MPEPAAGDVPLVVTDVPDRQRFEARRGGRLLGIAEYRLTPGVIDFTHTEVLPEMEGHGIGSELVRSALDAVRAKAGLAVVPSCPFVAVWIKRHRDYADLVAPGR